MNLTFWQFISGWFAGRAWLGLRIFQTIAAASSALLLLFGMAEAARANIRPLPAGKVAPAILSTDHYGYTVMTSTVTETGWLEANSILGLQIAVNAADDGVSDPISLPFDFPFYETTFGAVILDSNGLLHFRPDDSLASNQTIPNTEQPDCYIAPFWDDLYVGPTGSFTGTVHYMVGGVSPNSYAVFEWHNVSPLIDHNAPLIFETVLHENGDIVFLYKSMAGDLTGATVGLENPNGLDGSLFAYNQPGIYSGLAVRFERPAVTSVRVQSLTPFASSLLAGGSGEAQLAFRNIGHNAGDQFSLSFAASSEWDLTLENLDPSQPLKDENLDGRLETPVIPFGETVTITVRVSGLSALQPGFAVSIPVTATSLTDSFYSASGLTRFATPVPFVYSFTDQSDNNRLGYISPFIHKEPTLYASFGRNHSLARSSAGDYFYAWDRQHLTAWGLVSNIEIAIFDDLAQVKKYIFTPYDHTTIPADLFQDTQPAVASAPNGNIGVLFLRYNPQTGVSNLFFMLLAPNGDLITAAPVNLTGQQGNTLQNAEPGLVVSGDGKFLAAWSVFDYSNSAKNIWLAVLNPETGALITQSAATDSTGKNIIYDAPLLVGLNTANVALFYQETRLQDQIEVFNTHILQVPSSGLPPGMGPVGNQLVLQGVSTAHRAGFQLGLNGPILFAWTGSIEGQVSYILIDQNITSAGTTASLAQPDLVDVSVLGNIEVGCDPLGRGIILWMDVTRQRRIYYAVVDPIAGIITPTLIFKDAGPGYHWGTSAAMINIEPFEGFYELKLPVLRR